MKSGSTAVVGFESCRLSCSTHLLALEIPSNCSQPPGFSDDAQRPAFAFPAARLFPTHLGRPSTRTSWRKSSAKMSDRDSPVGSPAAGPVDDGQEKEFQNDLAGEGSDRDSDALSEIDENEFEDYDPETANIEDRPVNIDEDVARTLKASKRKRVAGDAPKKPREGRREKKKRDGNDQVAVEDGGVDSDAKSQRRARRAGDGGERPRAKPDAPEPEGEENLSPEERRKRAIDRALDAAMKKGGTTKRRRKDEIVSKHSVLGDASSSVRAHGD